MIEEASLFECRQNAMLSASDTQKHMSAHTHIYTRTHVHTNNFTRTHSQTDMHTHTRTHIHKHTKKKHHETTPMYTNTNTNMRTHARARAHTHTHMRMDVQWAPLLYAHWSPLRAHHHSPLLTDNPMTRCGALGLRGERAKPIRQGVWCLLPVELKAVPIHTQCSDQYLRDEASLLSNQLQ